MRASLARCTIIIAMSWRPASFHTGLVCGARGALPLLLCCFVASPAGYADTETITLSCDLDVKTQPPHGDSRHSHETAVVEMLFDAATGFKAIRIYSVAIPVAVANKKG